jgi:hypothetical protein
MPLAATRLFALLALLLPALALAKPAAKPAPPSLPLTLEPTDGFLLGPGLKLVPDELLGHDVLESPAGNTRTWIALTADLAAPYEVVAKVRLADGAAFRMATLAYRFEGPPANPRTPIQVQAIAQPNHGARTLYLVPSFIGGKSAGYLNHVQLLKDQAASPPPGPTWLRERFRDISPLWDTAFREELEAAIAHVPPVADRWCELRIVPGADFVRIYQDGYLLAERRPAGDLRAGADGGVRAAPAADADPRLRDRAARGLLQRRPE